MKIPFTNIVIGKQEVRSLDPYRDLFYGTTTGTTTVSQDSVQGIAAWTRGKAIYSNAIAGLPKNLYRRTEDGREVVTDHASTKLIKLMANSNLTSLAWHDYMVGTAIDTGNSYSAISRDKNNNPTELTLIDPSKVTVEVYSNTVRYVVEGKNEPIYIMWEDMYHIKGATNNGYYGYNPLKAHATTLGLSLSTSEFAKNLYDSNTNLEGYIKFPGKLDVETIKKTRTSWQKNYGGVGTSSTAFLDQAMEYVPLSMTPENAQTIQIMKYTSKNIATILGLPAHMINEMEEAKYNNVELTGIEFVKYSLLAWVNKFEVEDNKLLTTAEQGNLFWKYNVNGLMRGDSKARAEFYKNLVGIGAMSPNQVRSLEEMDRYAGGDEYYISANNLVPVSKLDEFYKNGTNNKGGQNE